MLDSESEYVKICMSLVLKFLENHVITSRSVLEVIQLISLLTVMCP